MKRTSLSRFFAAALFAGALSGAASVAQARTDVQLSIGLPPPPVFVRPAPFYGPPRPLYGPPAVVYERPWRPSARHEYERERERAWRQAEWQRREWERREWERRHHGWDRFAPPDRHGRN